MIEREWLECTNPRSLLEFLRGKTSDRKLRLFACAYGRAIREGQHLLGPSTVAVAERYADGLANDQDLASERRRWAVSAEERAPVAASAYQGAWEVVDLLTSDAELMKIDPDALPYFPVPLDVVLKRAVLLLRDIVSNPFRPATVEAVWLTTDVVTLAQGIYQERAFDRIPILGDALEDAGCADADMLEHCRTSEGHVRGCWLVDLLLGKK
jgi:hypothetical protein